MFVGANIVLLTFQALLPFMAFITLYSAKTLENWDWDTPYTRGIGGSETAHIEMARELSLTHNVHSIVPSGKRYAESPKLTWNDTEKYEYAHDLSKVFIIYRDHSFFDRELHPLTKHWFIAQDTDYGWTESQINKVDRYICLCREHAKHIETRYPSIAAKIFISSNGINPALIKDALGKNLVRNPKKLIYSSSPDRGLILLLQNWFRIREAVPDAELHVFYGFNNMETLINMGAHNLAGIQISAKNLLKQPGIIWRGRVDKKTLYEEMTTSNIWPYFTDWPETSCITSMEMQALGVIPVTNKHWALRDNILEGVLIDGVPQLDNLTKHRLIAETINLLKNPVEDRRVMMEDALDTFNWGKIAKQWNKWIEEDTIGYRA